MHFLISVIIARVCSNEMTELRRFRACKLKVIEGIEVVSKQLSQEQIKKN
jgi:hypothetical protein